MRRRFYGVIGQCKALLMRRFVLRIFRKKHLMRLPIFFQIYTPYKKNDEKKSALNLKVLAVIHHNRLLSTNCQNGVCTVLFFFVLLFPSITY